MVPRLDNITFANNYRNAVEISPQDWTSNSWNSETVIYWLRGDTTILASNTLTIPAGIRIKAAAGAKLYINGKLTAEGTLAAPITITSDKDDTLCAIGAADEPMCDTNNDDTTSVPGSGDWGFIEFSAGSDANSVLRRAILRYGGYTPVGCCSGLSTGPIRILNISPTLENISFAGNYRNAVEISPQNWTSNSWSSSTVIYWLRGNTTIIAANVLTIAPGAKIKGAFGAKLFINGRLIADGTQIAPITFSSDKDDTICGSGASNEPVCDTNNDGINTVPMAGDWGYIEFGARSDPASILRRAVIRYGGYTRFDDCCSSLSTTPIRLLNVAPTLDRITFIGNYRNAAEISPQSWSTNAWNSTSVIYWLRGDTTIIPANVLTITPGVKFKGASGAKLYINGKLVADGTQEAPITFTSEKDDTVCGIGASDEAVCDTNNDGTGSVPRIGGDWGWIEFSATSDPSSIIRRAIIRYGGYAPNGCCSTISNVPIRLFSVSPTLENITFVYNYRNAAEIVPGNWTTAKWNSRSVIYWMTGNSTVLASNTLTISAGVNIKITNGANLYIRRY